MRNIIYNLPEQIKDAWKINVHVKKQRRNYENIVISGMGGSGIGGDILKALTLQTLKVPLVTVKDYQIPGFVNRNTLFIAVSYSGNTEETISTVYEAKNRNAHIVAITSGGSLWELCKKYQIDCIDIPSGISSRCAIGYLFFPQLKILSSLNFVKDMQKDVSETINVLIRYRNYYERFAKKFATSLIGSLPIIYATSHILAPVATRWQTQFNENAEIIAHSNVFPELDHNEIMGITNTNPLVPIYCLILTDSASHPRNLLRVKYTLKILQREFTNSNSRNFFKVKKFVARGSSPLAKIFSMIMLGDFISFYLAHARGIKPEIIRAIDELKKMLSNNNKLIKHKGEKNV
ncbi:MAG: bifunctional phosphoglucose/phosphomannose isomerase [candidate division WOR-3 bacterium]|nr:bifunctional phosphoglucose/phosphomannose isomerase [candidate division WOR-3 bacterium]MCX7757330.1 bifunctional phosphoglucose/phosphomannose isomerase [candidate division WOR-3 bacterium]MDW7988103.1 bifunctional phosphoglucose/phosphomannose isomerase [candidate division WOR-3 bacterium]